MPYEVSWEPRGYVKRVYGCVTGSEFLESIVAVQNDPRFDDLRYGINDFLGVEDFDVSESNVVDYSAYGIGASFTNARIRIAVVTTHPGIVAMIRKYATLAPYPLEFFETVEAARTWVERPPPPVGRQGTMATPRAPQ